jgi:hypothetical protein
MNWIDLLTQFDWQKIATAAIAIAVAWWERRNIKEAAVRFGKKATSVFKSKAKELQAAEPDNRTELAAALHLIADAVCGTCPECDKAVETLAKKLVWRWEADNADGD